MASDEHTFSTTFNFCETEKVGVVTLESFEGESVPFLFPTPGDN